MLYCPGQCLYELDKESWLTFWNTPSTSWLTLTLILRGNGIILRTVGSLTMLPCWRSRAWEQSFNVCTVQIKLMVFNLALYERRRPGCRCLLSCRCSLMLLTPLSSNLSLQGGGDTNHHWGNLTETQQRESDTEQGKKEETKSGFRFRYNLSERIKVLLWWKSGFWPHFF